MEQIKRCEIYANGSKAEIKFGAFIEKHGKILGFGCNKRPTNNERNLAIKFLGKKLDYCIHAEELALINSKKNNNDLSNSKLYVAGFLQNKLIKRKKPFFTCPRCAERVLVNYGIPVYVHTNSGWQELSPKQALKTSLTFKGTNFWKRTARQK